MYFKASKTKMIIPKEVAFFSSFWDRYLPRSKPSKVKVALTMEKIIKATDV